MPARLAERYTHTGTVWGQRDLFVPSGPESVATFLPLIQEKVHREKEKRGRGFTLCEAPPALH